MLTRVLFTSKRLLFRKKDYALFRHIIWNNIGEESRHLDEWDRLQNLPSEELQAYKEKIMVHFGYDKKDAPPTTFWFKVNISSIIMHFCLDESNHVADVEGTKLCWSLKKVKDRISRQLLKRLEVFTSHRQVIIEIGQDSKKSHRISLSQHRIR